jgi:hypothetical protein
MSEATNAFLNDAVSRGHSLIPRVRGITREQFRSEYETRGRPVILEGKVDGWPAAHWTPDVLKEKYGSVVCHASLDLPDGASVGVHDWKSHTKWMPLAEFVDRMRSSTKPCYMQQVPKQLFGEIEKNFNFSELTNLEGGNLFINIFLGTSNTNSSIHYDMPNNFLAQIYGTKQVFMFSPEQRKNIPVFPDTLRMSPIDPYAPDYATYPTFRDARGTVGVIGPGDILFIPRVWWHQLRSVGESISVNCWYGREESAAYFLKIAAANRVKHFLVPFKDFVVLGLLQRPHTQRLFGDEPTGLWLFKQFAGAVKRRLHYQA